MHFNPKLFLAFLATVPSAFAALNGKCDGVSGICINTSTCQSYGGQSISGKCPSDPNDVKCCQTITCNSNGRSGTCMFTDQCDGEKVSGLCPGGNDFKCCIKSQKTEGVGERCNGVAGTCIDVNTTTCPTQTVTGKCPGPNNVRCCPDSTTPATDPNVGKPCNGVAGTCIDVNTSTCPNQTLTGKCPGGNNIRCCPDSTTDPNVGKPCNGVAGTCIDVNTSTCPNQTLTGKCPGGNNIRCCPDSTTPSTDPNVGKPCNGVAGTCIDVNTSTCPNQTLTGKCPGGNNIRCCPDSTTPSTDPNVGKPCNGVAGTCIDVNTSTCPNQTLTGKCPGGNNIRCCPDSNSNGNRPGWYINQNDHTEVICTIPGSSPENKTVKSSGCGISCLSMAINILRGVYVTPETLFREGYNAGQYWGDGFSHDALSYLGGNHGVNISWTGNLDTVYSALQQGKPVIFHTGFENTYHFTSTKDGGHYILLYGSNTVNGIQKVYVFDPNGGNNHINELMTLRSANGGIEVAKRGRADGDFGIVSN